jgi:excisionase family DNA binding protein
VQHTQALEETTYVPSDSERDQLAEVLRFIEAHDEAGRGAIEPRYFLAGKGTGEQVALPPHVYQVVRQVVEAMRRGLAVSVVPRSHVLTTQQAADLLGVSRPTVIKLLDGGQIPFTKAGSHRRIRLDDVLAYGERRRDQQYAALEARAGDYRDEEDLESVLTDLRDVRKRIAADRRRVRVR